MSVSKWTAVILVTGVAAYIAFMLFVMNPIVLDQIKTEPDSEMAGEALALTLASGKEIPVNYLKEGDTVFVGADGPWWREFQNGPTPVALVIKSENYQGLATVVLDDPEYTESIFKRLRPTQPDWLPEWMKGKLIVIKLTQ